MPRRKPIVSDGDIRAEIDADGFVLETATEPDSSLNRATTSTEGFFDPGTIGQDGSGAGGEPVRRGRGRPKGSGSKKPAASVRAVGAEGVASLLSLLHSGLVIATKSPEFELSDDEAAKLARASIAVANLYSVEASEKAMAWTALIGVAGAIYLPRFAAVGIRRKMEKSAKQGGDNVSMFPSPSQPNGGIRPN